MKLPLSLSDTVDFFQKLYNSNYQSVVIVVPGSTQRFFNKAFQELTGYTEEELSAPGMDRLIIPDIIERICASINDGEDVPIRLEHEITRKDGSNLFVEATIHVVRDENGRERITFCTFNDITEKKRAEKTILTQRDLGLALNKASSLQEALPLCLKTAIEVSGMDCGGVYLKDDEKPEFHLFCFQGLSEEFAGSISVFHESAENIQMVMSGRPHYIEFSKMSKQVNDLPPNVMNFLATIPIVSDGKVIAVFYIGSYKREGASEYGRAALESVSAVMGGAITRIKAREQLKKSEEQYRHIVENINDIISEIDKDQVFTYTSSKVFEILGYRPEEIVGKSYYDVMAPEEAERVKQKLQPLFDEMRSVFHLEKRLIHKNGEEVVFETSFIPMIDEKGGIRGYRNICRDITARKKAEEALRESEERYRFLVENINECIYTLDSRGNFTYISPAIEKIGRYKQEDFIGRNIGKFVSPGDLPYVMGLLETLLSGTPVYFECRVVGKDGTLRHAAISGHLLQEEGRPPKIFGVFSDINRRKQAEEARQRSEALYRAIVEDQTEMICRFLAEGRLTFVNGAYSRYFGRSGEELVGSNFLLLLPETERKTVYNCLRRLTWESPVCSIEYQVVAADEKKRWQQWTYRSVFNDKGEVAEIQAVGRDVTERYKAEERLRYLSFHDALTGLYNRAYFEEEMCRREDEKNPLAGIIICDLDGLKLINDTMGHDAGDKLLRVTAEILQKCFRSSDVVSRIGGDEFAVVIPKCTKTVLEKRSRRVRITVEKYNRDHPELPISLSLGYAMAKRSSAKMLSVFREADNNMYREKLHHSRSSRSGIVDMLMRALGERDFITQGHAERMKDMATLLGEAVGMSERGLADLRLLAQFHDIGKVSVPDSILFKPSSLTEEEYERIKRHSESGHRIALSSPDLAHIADWILKHHEWWNGKGYPLGIRGSEIPLECRILSIVDAFDAMTSERPYRRALSQERAIEELIQNKGSQFEPELIDKFIGVLRAKPSPS